MEALLENVHAICVMDDTDWQYHSNVVEQWLWINKEDGEISLKTYSLQGQYQSIQLPVTNKQQKQRKDADYTNH